MKTTKEKMKETLENLSIDFRKLRTKYVSKLLPLFEENDWNVWLYSLQNEIEKLENILFFYARIHDCISGKINETIERNWYSQRGSMKKKVRKLLWYSIP